MDKKKEKRSIFLRVRYALGTHSFDYSTNKTMIKIRQADEESREISIIVDGTSNSASI
jgi:hypothetical protein